MDAGVAPELAPSVMQTLRLDAVRAGPALMDGAGAAPAPPEAVLDALALSHTSVRESLLDGVDAAPGLGPVLDAVVFPACGCAMCCSTRRVRRQTWRATSSVDCRFPRHREQ